MKATQHLLVAAFLGACTSGPEPDAFQPDDVAIRAVDVQAHVDYLASDELQGRYAAAEGAQRAAAYVVEEFVRAGLEPFAGPGSWYQEIEEELAPNVIGLVRGTGVGYLVVSAHYDHLRPRESGDDRIYNGADDNASGTAVVLELARAFGWRAAQGDRPERSLVFVAFTAEEMGLRGSHFFVEHPPVELTEIVGDVNLDMISRGREDLIFCEAGEGSDALLEAARTANAALGELEVRYGEHPEWLAQSDQYAFLQRGVPAIYFGVEDHPDYHQVSDHADRILPELAARVGRLVERMLAEL